MIPVMLRFQAFGPYTEMQEIDFTQFWQDGILLIHGETGAGKTVIFDAMTYALYGRSSGGHRGNLGAMRCLVAPENLPTELEFLFEVRGKRYLFTRKLRLRKKRAGGVEYIPEQDAFYFDDAGQAVSFFENPKAKLVEQKAQEMIGLDCVQFCQVMILPQGQFEKLLLAKSEEKEAVLVNLFHAERWHKIAEQICADANLLRQELDGLRLSVKAALDANGCEDARQLSEKAKQLETALAQTAAQRACAAQNEQQVRIGYEQAVLYEDALKRKALLLEAQKKLNGMQNQVEAAREMLEAARTAERILPVWQQYQSAKVQYELRQDSYLSAVKQEQAAKAQLEETRQNLHALREKEPEQQAKKQRIAQLETMLKQAGQLQKIQEKIQQTQTDCQKAQQQEANAAAKVLELQMALEDIRRQEAQVLSGYVMRLPQMQQKQLEMREQKKKLAEIARQRQELEGLQSQYQKLEQPLRTLQADCKAAQERYNRAYQLFLENAAYSIALTLSPGDSCPVCGSIHHPDKMHKPETQQGEASLQEAADALEKANQKVTVHQLQMSYCKEEIARLKAELLSGETLEADTAVYDADQEKALLSWIEQAQEKQRQLPDMREKITNLDMQIQQAKAQQEALHKITQQILLEQERFSTEARLLMEQAGDGFATVEQMRPELEALSQQAKTHEQQLVQAQDHEREAIEVFAAAAAAVQHGKAEYESATAAQETHQQVFEAHLRHSAFADAVSFQRAVRSEEQQTAYAEQIATYENEKQALVGELAALADQLQTKPEKPSQELGEELERLRAEKEMLDNKLGALGEQKSRMDAEIAKIKSALEKLETKQVLHDKMAGFGKLLRGDNGVSLRRYVLGVMLSAVTVQANLLLKTVHGGRYQLYRTMEGITRAHKVGLDLEILDGHAGKTRPVTSLSGGEKFLVSLALALGLSAVVQAQSGGVRMEAMFIDEGFGTLDPQSISDALGVLASVKGSRRLMGIISHVQALQETIETSIEVVKDRRGSRLEIHM